ncbi:GTP 3',8-cyclase MoaA [Kytococcus sedentarius]|uniref:GTP 3',8-cyclase n=1 Tax=Kytococcus sedentarius (strain ATCC 14392 / DSM 20547 / JCM 11482 / CCUG 33030 / NBRC 15357 / NCTC 11040 / CCM 314 / 541) TaxID=478801 RepID=C7NKF9_KYTSD|nr:GTP 3',8-cyclase MoaA [Kytococcus sedentarius]ACV06997.1 GTP cyclohydrolase subunit MoaA [Kytococcus sedentarius DSM 20547]QQB62996.1 GTP 3',8-cyclase MoaA [Kytococcus sedentarius]STX14175.1 Probable molybdopterin cofactor synthesis protein A [Kytococcus sedentarius]
MSHLPLVDRFGRVATDLRLSVTDVCNLRCTYCLPEVVDGWLPRAEVLDREELVRLARIGTRTLGIEKIRLTGGEPLTRPDLVEIVADLHRALPEVELALTTNGLGLARKAGALREAGLSRVNVSLDTVDRHTYAQITRRGRLDEVLEGLSAAVAAGLTPVKVNCVPTRGINDDGLLDLVDHCVETGCELRFIEQMPIGAPRDWARENLVTAQEVRAQVATRYELREVPARGAAPAELFDLWRDGEQMGRIGTIASVTEPFCGSCDRTRISADGQLRSCLFSQDETDLRGLLRGGADDEQIARAWLGTMAAKPRAHGSDAGGFGEDFVQPERPMNAIGG